MPELVALRAEREELCAQINGLDRDIRRAARDRGIQWRRLYTRRLLLWRRLSSIERRLVQLYVEDRSRSRG